MTATAARSASTNGVTVITFWSGIGGGVPDGPLIFCTCAGIRGQGIWRTASGRRIRPPGCVTHSQSGRSLAPLGASVR